MTKHARLIAALLLAATPALAQNAAPPPATIKPPAAAKPPTEEKELTNAKGETLVHLFGRGLIAGANGQLEQAVKFYGEVIALDPKHQEAYANRGIVHYVLGQYQKAIGDFDAALALDETDASLIENRALAYLKLNQPDKALIDLDRILSLDAENFSRSRGNARALYARGLARIALSDTSGGYGDIALAKERNQTIERDFTEQKFKPPPAAPNPLPASNGQLFARFQYAVENPGKEPLMVQLTVVDERGGNRKSTCVASTGLINALQAENNLKADGAGLATARKLALDNKARVFHFSKQAAIDALKIGFTQKEHDAARAKVKADVEMAPYAGFLPGYRLKAGEENALACVFVENGKQVRLGTTDKIVLP